MSDVTPDVTVLRIGTQVQLGNGEKATINGISIYPNMSVEYRVVWWNGHERMCVWVTEDEALEVNNGSVMVVGFK